MSSQARTLGSNNDNTVADTDVPDGGVISALTKKEDHRTVVLKGNVEAGQQRKQNENYITTAKYTIVTFLPKFLFEQFRRYANIFFLTIGLLQQIPDVSPTGRYVTIVPFTFILMLTALKELYEDSKRHSSDRKANSNNTQIFDKSEKKFIDAQWRNLCVGDIIKVQGGSFFPADLILLSSSDPGGICYIETANLDGETNLKLREALPVTLDYTSEDKIDGLEGRVECEQPNSNLYKFNGNIKLLEQDHASPLNLSSLLLRGAKLMNTEWICGKYNSFEKSIQIFKKSLL